MAHERLYFSARAGRQMMAGCCLASMVIFAQSALAQTAATATTSSADTPPAAAPTDDNKLGDIIVTARYVKEKVQDTPISITAQTQVQLQAANVTNIGSLGSVVPNLYTVPGDSQAAGSPRIRLRGIAQGDIPNPAVPPAIAIYTDDIYHGTTAGSELDLTDVDHIEVERGPQSTLSGNASIAGVVKIYTKDPQGDNSGWMQLVAGSRDKYGGSGALDLGITSTLAARATVNYERQQGFVDRLDFACEMKKLGTPQLAANFPSTEPDAANHNCVIGHLGGYNHFTGQLKLRWRPNDKLDVQLEARRHIERDEETPEVSLAYTGSTVSNVAAYTAAINDTFGPGLALDNRFLAPAGTGGYATYATNCRPYLPTLSARAGSPQPSGQCYPQSKQADSQLYSAKAHYDITDAVHLTAIGGYTRYSNEFTQDGDQSPLGYALTHFYNKDHEKTGELRLDGKLFDNKLNWVVGGFIQRLVAYQINSLALITSPSTSNVRAATNSQSGFVHLDYSITSRWRVSGGTRYTDGKLSTVIQNSLFTFGNINATATEHRFDWLGSTDYKITNTILAYASAASGSRPAGVTTAGITARQFGPLAAEDLVDYEAGIKADLFHRRLRVNLNGFYIDYKSLSTTAKFFECLGQPGASATPFPENPVGSNHPDCSQFAPNTGFQQWNVPTSYPATIKGVEWEFVLLPIDDLRINWTGGWNHFHSKVQGQAPLPAGAINPPGYYYPGNHRQPIWSMHADATYDIHTSFGTFSPRVDWNWQSQQDFSNSPQNGPPAANLIIKPYGLWNAQISYRPNDSHLSASLQVTNLADRFTYYQPFPQTLDNQTRLGPPREFTFTLRRDF